ncbi:hypothetical protein [Pseudomonas sp. GL-R-19]|uniref:hypothetical protein n=1 Tax=Pseudomonas sp. GL-R-19 TaxID=2832391 RepID=UPI001CBFB94E|nr:hypothetical protein [Pseudomonas sp. GL-R-19]
MNRATPPCNAIALLLRSSPPCAMRLTLTTANAVSLDDFGPPAVSLWATASPATRRLFALIALIGAQFILPVILMYSFWSDYVLGAKGRMGDGFL